MRGGHVAGYAEQYRVDFGGQGDVNDGASVELSLPVKCGYIRVVHAPFDFAIYSGHGTSTPAVYVKAGDRIDIDLVEPVDRIFVVNQSLFDVPLGASFWVILLHISQNPNGIQGGMRQGINLIGWNTIAQAQAVYPWGNASQSGGAYLTPQSERGLVEVAGGEVTLDPASTVIVSALPAVMPLEQENRVYTVNGRVSTRVALSHVYAAAGRYQYMTLYRDNGSATTLRLLSLLVAIVATTAAATITAELNRLASGTTPATGNPAHTPATHLQTDAAAYTTALSLPATQGSELVASRQYDQWRVGITPAVPAVNPPDGLTWRELVRPRDVRGWKDFQTPPSTEGGWALVMDVSAATTLDLFYIATISEE